MVPPAASASAVDDAIALSTKMDCLGEPRNQPWKQIRVLSVAAEDNHEEDAGSGFWDPEAIIRLRQELDDKG